MLRGVVQFSGKQITYLQTHPAPSLADEMLRERLTRLKVREHQLVDLEMSEDQVEQLLDLLPAPGSGELLADECRQVLTAFLIELRQQFLNGANDTLV